VKVSAELCFHPISFTYFCTVLFIGKKKHSTNTHAMHFCGHVCDSQYGGLRFSMNYFHFNVFLNASSK
jgi:hypothetical protein